MMHDPIADFLTRIRNAIAQRHRYVDIPKSKLKVNLAKVFEDKGFVKEVVVQAEKNNIRIYLKYRAGLEPVLKGLKRNSKPGLRRYVGYQEIPRVLGGMGMPILSTNRGILSGQDARQQKVGGEILCTIW